MNKLIIKRLLFGVLFIPILFNSLFAQQNKRKKYLITTVNFCDLMKNPQKHINKVIRIEANYIVWWESSYLYSDACKDNKYKISNGFDCDDQDEKCLRQKYKEWEKLNPYLRGKNDSDAERVRTVLIGRLIGPDSFGHLGGFKY